MSVKKRIRLYYLVMLIFPILISLIAFVLATNFFEEEYVFKSSDYSEYIGHASNVLDYVKKEKEFKLSQFEEYARANGYGFYVKKDGTEYFKNLNADEESTIKSIKVIEYDVVYQFGGKVTIATQMEYDDGVYDLYFISRGSVAPFISIRLIELLILVILTISFIVVAITNSIVAGSMVNSILSPLESLSISASKIRQGDLSESIGKAGVYELEDLFSTFEMMRKELKTNINENVRNQESKREIMSGISHDLKTPLTVIQGYSKGILDGVTKNETQTKKYISVIYRKSIEMETLLNQLTIYSKLENNDYVIKKELINLDNFLKAFINKQKTEYLNKNVEFKYNNFIPIINVYIDTLQIQRVFENIISNSIKYTDKEVVKINFNVMMTGNKEITLLISDNGIGVKEKDLKNIFENFFRVDGARSTKVEGNGLGLSICKKIIELHSGQISAYSKDGLTIKITLPIGEKYE